MLYLPFCDQAKLAGDSQKWRFGLADTVVIIALDYVNFIKSIYGFNETSHSFEWLVCAVNLNYFPVMAL